MLVIGLMSGTSADGVDAALVEWPEDGEARPFRLRGFVELGFPRALQARIHRLAAGELPGAEVLRELIALDLELADRFAEAALAAAASAEVTMADVAVIASHGQTLAHHPELEGTLQIGCPSRLAERSRCRVVADFRPRDMAVGGQGAPLAPFFHLAVMGSPDEDRVALNLGGIANLTWLPRSGDPAAVIAFDSGPANALIDGVVQLRTEGAERMDRDGLRAMRGRVSDALLAELMDDEYLRSPPPKSTGRERYGLAEARALHARSGLSDDDLVATLVAFTAQSVANACRDFLPAGARPARILVGGGGAANPAQMAALERAVEGVAVEPFDRVGVPLAAAEAMAFSLMGRNALLGLPNHLPQTTGAKRAAVLGELAPGPDDGPWWRARA